MTTYMVIPTEIIGLFILISAIAVRLHFPGLADFWLALATAIALFLIMHIRSYLVL